MADYSADNTRYTLLWKELVTSALLGTERRGISLRQSQNTLGKLLVSLDTLDDEQKLLGAAAAVAIYRRAGALPAQASGQNVEPCESDPTPMHNETAALHLSAMLNGQHRDLLDEWLMTLAKMGKRLGTWELAHILELGASDSSLRELIRPVLGKRGIWLAAQRPGWRSIYLPTPAEEDQAAWETGDRTTRLAVLAKLRADRPGHARELIEETWASEPADTRTAFVSALGKNLSMDDEPFLENALDDKSKQVREAVAEVLARLPGSRLVKRMTERVKPLVMLVAQRNLLGAKTYRLSVTLPEQLDKSAMRDGIGWKVHTAQGQKAGWLVDMLACVPPAIWCDMWGATPAEIIAAAHASEWKETLLQAWITAVEVFKDVEKAEALLASGPIAGKGYDGAPLLSVLPPQRREEWVLELLRARNNALQTQELTLRMLWRLDTPWSAEVSRVVLRAVKEYIQATAEKGDWELRGSILYLARAMSPDVLDEAVSALSGVQDTRSFYSESLDKFAAIAQFRGEMLRALWT